LLFKDLNNNLVDAGAFRDVFTGKELKENPPKEKRPQQSRSYLASSNPHSNPCFYKTSVAHMGKYDYFKEKYKVKVL